MRLTRYGHATLLVETETTRVLIDPGTYSTEWQVLRDLDAVLVTHEHHDHFDRENLITLMTANPGAEVVAPSAVSDSLLSAAVATRVIEPETALDIDGIHVETVGGQHALVHRRIPLVANIGFVLSTTSGPRLFHPGDAHDALPPAIDVLALPLTALWSTVRAAADFLERVGPEIAFPIHDAGASTTGHATHMRILGGLTPPGTNLVHLGPMSSIEV